MFDFVKMIAWYEKQLVSAVRAHGEDWRSELIRSRLDRIVELSALSSLSEDDMEFLLCRRAVFEGFTEKGNA